MTAFKRIMAWAAAGGMTQDQAAGEILSLADNYRGCFNGPQGQAVLQDLADACCMTDTAQAMRPDGSVDEAATLGNVGKQAVYQHIRNMIGLHDEDVETMFNRENENL